MVIKKILLEEIEKDFLDLKVFELLEFVFMYVESLFDKLVVYFVNIYLLIFIGYMIFVLFYFYLLLFKLMVGFN